MQEKKTKLVPPVRGGGFRVALRPKHLPRETVRSQEHTQGLPRARAQGQKILKKQPTTKQATVRGRTLQSWWPRPGGPWWPRPGGPWGPRPGGAVGAGTGAGGVAKAITASA